MKKSNDYHDYIIRGGKYIGEFEQMYADCENPWPENEDDLDSNPISCYTVLILRKYGFKKLLSIGSGKGLHANWLKTKIPDLEIDGCEISPKAVEYSRSHYPAIKAHCLDCKDFGNYEWDSDIILFREILWYILPYWGNITEVLMQKYSGKHIIIELSCYNNQQYGCEYFNGPEDVIRKFPFRIKEILRHHISPLQREGMVLIFGEI